MFTATLPDHIHCKYSNSFMEFFRIVKVKTTEHALQERIQLNNLDAVTNELFSLNEPEGNEVPIGGIWGEFTLSRSVIKGGLRFALLECPNALCWTITTGYPPDRDSLVIHLTINRQQKQQEFIDEIEAFLDDHNLCLKKLFSEVT